MRATCMAGRLPPRRAFRQMLALAVGFLGCVGAPGGSTQPQACAAAADMLLGGDGDGKVAAFHAHGSEPGVMRGRARALLEAAAEAEARDSSTDELEGVGRQPKPFKPKSLELV
eukprot:1908557-Prymnesium_polylepis.2